jgi:hypothetical protein
MDDLASLTEFMNASANAPAYEVKSYCTHSSLPILAPLVVANNDVLLGVEDAIKYELKNAVHITGRSFAIWASRYFVDVWEQAPFSIRSRGGIDADGMEDLRKAVALLEIQKAGGTGKLKGLA